MTKAFTTLQDVRTWLFNSGLAPWLETDDEFDGFASHLWLHGERRHPEEVLIEYLGDRLTDADRLALRQSIVAGDDGDNDE